MGRVSESRVAEGRVTEGRASEGRASDEQVAAVSNRSSAEGVTRPAPLDPIADRLRAWLSWFGVGRVVVSAVSMVIVCAGAFWLVRPPSPPAEAVLPQATAMPAAPSQPDQPDQPSFADQPDQTVDHPATTKTEVVVHVAGAVASPGVYRLRDGDRVDDAIGAAGGASAGADLDAVNLATVVVDGARIYVPAEGENVEVVEPVPSGADAPANGAAAVPGGLVDINRADATRLDELPGVGPATAAAIVAERERNGPFLTVDDLERVPGIGPAKLSGLRDLVSV